MKPGPSFIQNRDAMGLSNLGQLALLRAVIERDKVFRLKARGFSMLPFIRDGDVVTIEPMRGYPAEVGEVTAFTQNGSGKLAVHRVINREKRGWRMRGDNCPGDDGIIPAGQIIGRITGVERRGRSRRLGIGPERRIIAWLVRSNMMRAWINGIRLPRRIASLTIRYIQNLQTYRNFASRFFRGTVTVTDANREESQWIRTYFNADGFDRLSMICPDAADVIAKRNGKPVAFARWVTANEPYPAIGRFRIEFLFVRTLYRGMGIGELLIQHVIRRVMQKGATELLLFIRQDENRALSLYRKLGFEPVILPELETQLKDEERQYGRRRMVMRRSLNERSSAARSA